MSDQPEVRLPVWHADQHGSVLEASAHLGDWHHQQLEFLRNRLAPMLFPYKKRHKAARQIRVIGSHYFHGVYTPVIKFKIWGNLTVVAVRAADGEGWVASIHPPFKAPTREATLDFIACVPKPRDLKRAACKQRLPEEWRFKKPSRKQSQYTIVMPDDYWFFSFIQHLAYSY